jgi:hypothetical protein
MIGKRRKEMGEEAWSEYQRKRKLDKAKNWKARNVQTVIDWRRKTKQKLIDYKGGKCEICGYNKDCLSSFHFHHKNPDEKSFAISSKGITRKLELLKQEVDKCQLLCANCHAEVHEILYSKQRAETKLRHEERLSKIKLSEEINKITKDCKQKDKIEKSTKFTKICNQKITINKPSKEELFKLLWEKPTIHIAKDYNVSDKAVEKWAKKYSLDKPPRGYWTKIKNK